MTQWNFGYGNALSEIKGEGWAAETDTLHAIAAALAAQSPIKSIQRGGATVPTGGVDVTISAVDPAKAVVISETVGPNMAAAFIDGPTTLHIAGTVSTVGTYWQVIEFV